MTLLRLATHVWRVAEPLDLVRKLTLTGFEDLNLSGSTTGALEIYLADYRFSDNSKDYILDTWNQFDLTDLG